MKETGLFNKLKQLVNLPNGVDFSHSFLVSDIQMKNYQGGVYTINLISLQSIFLLSKVTFSSRGEKTWLEILNSLLAQSTLNYKKDLLLNSD